MFQETKQAVCCPPFDPALWDEKFIEWDRKKFIKDRVRTFFYVPVNFGSVMKKLDGKVKRADAAIPDCLFLADHTSRWNINLYLAVDREIPNAENVTLSGRYLSKVYEGPYKDTGKWCKDFESFAKSKRLEIRKLYMWYTTCPKCVKKYGKNYVVMMALVG
ncbi:MAG: hypothetical protein IT426_05510 [Pirellulales bacterium]|nr:hypothetical protein [Pirellulales bacterium]